MENSNFFMLFWVTIKTGYSDFVVISVNTYTLFDYRFFDIRSGISQLMETIQKSKAENKVLK
jgi:hypothetical protein